MAERQHARNELLRTSSTRNETVAGQVWINGWKIKEGRAFVASERIARLYRPRGCSVVCASGSRGPTAGPISVTRCIVCVNRRRGGRWHRCHRLPLCEQSMHTIAGRTRTPVMSLYRHRASGTPSFARAPFVRPSMPFLTSRVGVEFSSADYPRGGYQTQSQSVRSRACSFVRLYRETAARRVTSIILNTTRFPWLQASISRTGNPCVPSALRTTDLIYLCEWSSRRWSRKSTNQWLVELAATIWGDYPRGVKGEMTFYMFGGLFRGFTRYGSFLRPGIWRFVVWDVFESKHT